MSDGEVSREWINQTIKEAGGDPHALAVEIAERALAKSPTRSSQLRVMEAIEDVRQLPAFAGYFRVEEKPPIRSKLSVHEKSAYIREHGVDNYLGLPWDE